MGDASDLIKQFCAPHSATSIARASMPPAKKKTKATGGGKQNSLVGAGMFPMLSKTSVAIGLFCLVPGTFSPTASACGSQSEPTAASSGRTARPFSSATWRILARAVRWT